MWSGHHGYETDVIFRAADRRRPDPDRTQRDELLSTFEATFGRPPDDLEGDQATLDGLPFVYAERTWVLRPDCDRCGCHAVDQFPLEDWTVAGATVKAQARATCRNCRFLALAF